MTRIKKSFYNTVHGPNHHWWVLAVTSLGTFMSCYDAGAVNISLPNIMVSFQTSLAATSWVILAYLLTATAFLLPAGRLGDIIGRKKIYNLGFLIFIAGSFLCGFSATAIQLILFRILQAVGVAMLQTSSFAIITASFPERDRGKALGLGSTVAAIGTTLGPSLGGLIVAAAGWRGIFFLNVPVGLLGTVLGYLVLQEGIVTSPTRQSSRNFDIGGALLAAVGIGFLLVGLSLGQEGNWTSWETQVFLGMALLAIAAFPWYESRQTNPLVDMGLFKNRTFSFNMAGRFICFLSISANSLLMPFYLQIVRDYSPAQAGLFIAPMSLVIATVSPVAGWLTNYINTRILSSTGMALMGLSLYFLSRLDPLSSYAEVLWGLTLLGLGNAVFQTPNNTSIMDSVESEKFGITSGILSLVRNTARALGISLASTIVVASMFSSVGRISIHSLKRDPSLLGSGTAALSHGIGTAFFAASLVCIPGVIFSLIRGKTERDKGRHHITT
ncbi:MAG: MFS transporter [Desulfobacterales bacterium]|nr:MFS transporter [Desulfobacterales bacterium]